MKDSATAQREAKAKGERRNERERYSEARSKMCDTDRASAAAVRRTANAAHESEGGDGSATTPRAHAASRGGQVGRATPAIARANALAEDRRRVDVVAGMCAAWLPSARPALMQPGSPLHQTQSAPCRQGPATAAHAPRRPPADAHTLRRLVPAGV